MKASIEVGANAAQYISEHDRMIKASTKWRNDAIKNLRDVKAEAAKASTAEFKANWEAQVKSQAAAIESAKKAQFASQTADLRNMRGGSLANSDMQQRLEALHSRQAHERGKSGRGGNSANASAQIADIAVQLQGGTPLATIIGQQGSQLLGGLGKSGAAAGAAVAIGAAIKTASDASQKEFEAMTESAKAFGDALSKIASTDFAGMSNGLEASHAHLKNIVTSTDELQKGGVKGLWTMFKDGAAALTGNDTSFDKVKKNAQTEIELRGKIAEAEERMVAGAKATAYLVQLRAENRDDEADALERQIALYDRLKAIEVSPFSEDTKAGLREAAQQEHDAKKAAEDERRRKKRQAEMDRADEIAAEHNKKHADIIARQAEEEADKVEEAQKRIAAAKKEAAQVGETADERLNRLRLEQMADKKSMGAMRPGAEREEIAVRMAERETTMRETLKDVDAEIVAIRRNDRAEAEAERTKAAAERADAKNAALELFNMKVAEKLKTPEQLEREKQDRKARDKAERDIAREELEKTMPGWNSMDGEKRQEEIDKKIKRNREKRGEWLAWAIPREGDKNDPRKGNDIGARREQNKADGKSKDTGFLGTMAKTLTTIQGNITTLVQKVAIPLG